MQYSTDLETGVSWTAWAQFGTIMGKLIACMNVLFLGSENPLDVVSLLSLAQRRTSMKLIQQSVKIWKNTAKSELI